MNYEHLNMGSYNLHIIKTKKFKTITVEVNFRRKLIKEEITKRNLLKAVLLNSNNNFKKELDLIRETENLYDLKLISANTRIGSFSNLSFKIRFLNEQYTENSMNEYSIAFLMDILFNPHIENNAFNNDVVRKNKNKLEKSIKKLKDNKLKYTLFKLLETTKDMPYSYNPYGNIDDLEKINSKNLYEYYLSMLKDDYIDIFVVGDVDTTTIKNLMKKYFKVTTFKKVKNDLLIDELPILKTPKKYQESDSVNQSQLTILCNINNLTDYERKYVSLVYNELLGGSSSSLLFDTVREKNSYAYYVNSTIKPYDNTMIIYSGIENGNSNNVIKLIKKTLQNINKGNFDNKLLESSKETLIASIKASTDSPSGIINTYYAKILASSDDFEKRIEQIKNVTKEDIINISKKINIHTIYLLERTEEDEKN